MAKKLIKCKFCGAEIAKSATTCPQCGAKIKHTLLGILLTIIGILLLIGAFGNLLSDEPKKVGEDNSSLPSESQMPTAFGVTDKVELNDVIVTLNSVTENKGSQFNKPSDGKIFVIFEFIIENNSKKDLAISSLMCFETYIDDFVTNMSLTAMIESDKGQLDGTVAAGKKMNGVIGYEVPSDYKNVEIRFTPDFWNGTDITFIYAK